MKVYAQTFSRLAPALVLTFALMGSSAAQITSPTGSFGFLLNASYSNPSSQGGEAILGEMTFDGVGNMSGSYTLELGSGGALPVTTIAGNLTGTYSSNPDGTGSITIALDQGIALTLDMVLDDGGHGLQLAVTSCSGSCDLSGVVISGVGRHKAMHRKSVASLQGSYGVQFTKASPVPAASLEVASFDGAGNVTLSGTFVGTGGQAASGAFTGTYSVDPDGTGNINLPRTTGQGAQTFVFVITDGNSGLVLLQTNRLGDGVLCGTGRLQ
jgi:hypothetical protein